MSESGVVQSIRRALEQRGCIVVKTHGSKFFPKGFPDLIVIRPDGVTCYVEAKVPGRTDGPQSDGLTMKQCEWLWRLAEQGCRAGSAVSAQEAIRVVFGPERGLGESELST